MKNLLPLLGLLIISFSVAAKRDKIEPDHGVITCSEFHITQPLRELVKKFPVNENELPKKREEESEDREHRKPQKFVYSVRDGEQYGNAPSLLQTQMGAVPGRAPIANWPGQSATGFRPMDPTGAAGPNHYVQMINSTTFRVYNKTSGATMLTFTLGNLWTPATPNSGDPIVLYDKAADRWFLAQFGTTGNKMYIAISVTNDPTGAYYTYSFTSPEFPDYLKFSVWSDGYYMTSNQTQKVFAFERDSMLAGVASSRAIYTLFSPPEGTGFFCPLPGDAADGTLPPAGTPCPIFSYSDNAWGAGIIDGVNIYQMATNWSTATATITSAGSIPTQAFDASYDPSWNDISQPGTTQKLDGIGGVCMYRAQWKSWSGYNTVLLNWGVKISTSQRSIMWCELRQDQSTGNWSLFQDGIYTPDGATRWMGSMAMDKDGSIGIAYMKTDAANTIYPGLYYTGRRSCDPPGTLPITETQIVAGTGFQTGANRDGDYAHMCLDPDGSTFWYTSEYFGGTSGSTVARTQICSFQITPCGNTASVYISLTGGTNPSCPGTSLTFTATPTNGGSSPTYQWQVNGSNVGTNSPTYTSSSLTNGQIVSCIMTSNMVGVTGNPATSNSITVTVNPVVTPSVVIAQTTGTNPSCAGNSVQFTATPTNGGSAPSYQWKVNGVNAGTNSPTFTTSTLTNGQIVSCVMTSNANCATTTTATSNSLTMIINAVGNHTVTIAQTGGNNPACPGENVTYTATVSGAASISTYQWKIDGVNAGTNSSTFTSASLTNGQAVTCEVTAVPTCPAVTYYTVGTGTTTNTTISDAGVAYPTYYGNGRQQYLIRSTELTALGLTNGNINAIGFNVAGTTGNPATLNSYTIKIAQVTNTSMTNTTFLVPAGGFTTVYGPINFTPTLNGVNLHTFTTPFNWTGSNLLIDICFSSGVVGTVAYQNYQTASSFSSSIYYQVDGVVSTACTQTTGTARVSMRPNIIFARGSSAPVVAISNSQTANISAVCGTSATIKVFIQGFYIGTGQMRPVLYNNGFSSDPTACDTITIDLHNPTSPYAVSESVKALLHTNGNANVTFSSGAAGRPYYIVIRHRNSLETWSANTVTINNGVTYDFTISASQAFGSNAVVLSGSEFGNYSGDVDQNGVIDLYDQTLIENYTELFLTGYYTNDLTGDGQVESADYSLIENNQARTIIHP